MKEKDKSIVNNLLKEVWRYAKKILVDIQKDTDGDGWRDAIEIELGSDPYDSKSTPSYDWCL